MEVVDLEAPEYLTWKSADGTRVVRLGHTLIRNIHIEIMRGFGVTRRRGTEPGGVLIGHQDGNVLTIDDFEVVPCEYAFGPSYLLSPNDEPGFADAVERAGGKAVGYFRSHTRDGLTLDKADVDLFRKFLLESGRLALILKPFATRPASASLFFADAKGRLHAGETPHEFPFSARLEAVVAEPDPVPAAPPPPPPVTQAPVAATPAREPSPEPASQGTAVRPSREHRRVLTGVLGLRDPFPEAELGADESDMSPREEQRRRGLQTVALSVLFTAAVLTAGFVAGLQFAGGEISLLPPALKRAEPPVSFDLGLRAQGAGERVRVQWSKQSPAVRQASGGTMYIRDGAEVRAVPLHPEEVKDGSILHLPQGGSVRFRLELSLPGDRTVTEAVEWKR